MSFGQDVELITACAAGAVVKLCEAETVDVPAAAVLCGIEIVGVLAHFAGSRLPVFLPRSPA